VEQVVSVNLPDARRLAIGVVLGQAAVTVIAALLGGAIGGRNAALSALLGGGISTIASLAMALLSFGRQAGASAQRALRALLTGEAVKIAIVVVLFVAVLRTLSVSPGAMFAGYVATFFVYWIALAIALPPLARNGRDTGIH
jgi:ATP synthase protein I